MEENGRRMRTDLIVARQTALGSENALRELEKHSGSVVQRSRVELSDIRLEAQRQRVDIERQRDELAFQVQGWCLTSTN